MAKRRSRGASSREDSKLRGQHSSTNPDQICMLPDELLVLILSFLTLKEAAATSILSHRWRYLWTFMPKLDFDGTIFLLKAYYTMGNPEQVLDKVERNYGKWVNHVIALNKGSTIEEFRVFLNLDKTYKSSIDGWIKYALARKVQRLELNLTSYAGKIIYSCDEFYTFPYELIPRDKGGSIDFKHLQRISLTYVNVNGETLVFFLRNCPLLEDLSVFKSGELSSLDINGPFPSLKRLEISFCPNLNSVEIRDANLIYLKYAGPRIHFLLENAPQLVEIFVGGMLANRMEDVISLFSSYLPQLETFTIDRVDKIYWKETRKFYSAVKMGNLKQLVVKADNYDDDSLLPLIKLLHASPCLQKFVLEVSHGEPEFVKRKIRNVASKSYAQLKEIMFVGYCGTPSDLELVMHFLENAVSLKKIVIDPLLPFETQYHYVTEYSLESRKAMVGRARAKRQLANIIPPSVNLEIR